MPNIYLTHGDKAGSKGNLRDWVFVGTEKECWNKIAGLDVRPLMLYRALKP